MPGGGPRKPGGAAPRGGMPGGKGIPKNRNYYEENSKKHPS